MYALVTPGTRDRRTGFEGNLPLYKNVQDSNPQLGGLQPNALILAIPQRVRVIGGDPVKNSVSVIECTSVYTYVQTVDRGISIIVDEERYPNVEHRELVKQWPHLRINIINRVLFAGSAVSNLLAIIRKQDDAMSFVLSHEDNLMNSASR